MDFVKRTTSIPTDENGKFIRPETYLKRITSSLDFPGYEHFTNWRKALKMREADAIRYALTMCGAIPMRPRRRRRKIQP